jgi:hypothetical protein
LFVSSIAVLRLQKLRQKNCSQRFT